MRNTAVARMAITYAYESGRIFIFVIDDAFYFGKSMDHWLINPNRIRAFGFLCQMTHLMKSGSLVTPLFILRQNLSCEELETCQHIALPDNQLTLPCNGETMKRMDTRDLGIYKTGSIEQ